MASSKGSKSAVGRAARYALTTTFVAVAKRATELTWKISAGKKPPKKSDPDVSLGEVVLWSAMSGAAVAVAKSLAARQAAPVADMVSGVRKDATADKGSGSTEKRSVSRSKKKDRAPAAEPTSARPSDES